MNNKLCIYTFYSNFNKELIIRYVATFYVKVIVVSTVICQCLVIWLAGGKWIIYYPRFMTLYVKLYSLRVCIMVSLALNRCLCLYTVILRQYIYIYMVFISSRQRNLPIRFLCDSSFSFNALSRYESNRWDGGCCDGKFREVKWGHRILVDADFFICIYGWAGIATRICFFRDPVFLAILFGCLDATVSNGEENLSGRRIVYSLVSVERRTKSSGASAETRYTSLCLTQWQQLATTVFRWPATKGVRQSYTSVQKESSLHRFNIFIYFF